MTGLTEEHVEAVRRAVRERYGSGVRAWVVGSRASGTHDSSSDLDVVVETPVRTVKEKDGKEMLGGHYFTSPTLGLDIDIIENPRGVRDDANVIRIQ